MNAIINKHHDAFYSRLNLKHCLKKILMCRSLLPQSNDNVNCQHCAYCNDPTKIVLILSDMINNKDLFITCDNVVCTMSIGYLKHNAKYLFEPINCIPQTKYSSIEKIEFGTTNKVKNLFSFILLKTYQIY